MLLECRHCKSKYKLDNSAIPSQKSTANKRVFVRCMQCDEKIFITSHIKPALVGIVCPKCETEYGVQRSQFKKPILKVRCFICKSLFDASIHRSLSPDSQADIKQKIKQQNQLSSEKFPSAFDLEELSENLENPEEFSEKEDATQTSKKDTDDSVVEDISFTSLTAADRLSKAQTLDKNIWKEELLKKIDTSDTSKTDETSENLSDLVEDATTKPSSELETKQTDSDIKEEVALSADSVSLDKPQDELDLTASTEQSTADNITTEEKPPLADDSQSTTEELTLKSPDNKEHPTKLSLQEKMEEINWDEDDLYDFEGELYEESQSEAPDGNGFDSQSKEAVDLKADFLPRSKLADEDKKLKSQDVDFFAASDLEDDSKNNNATDLSYKTSEGQDNLATTEKMFEQSAAAQEANESTSTPEKVYLDAIKINNIDMATISKSGTIPAEQKYKIFKKPQPGYLEMSYATASSASVDSFLTSKLFSKKSAGNNANQQYYSTMIAKKDARSKFWIYFFSFTLISLLIFIGLILPFL